MRFLVAVVLIETLLLALTPAHAQSVPVPHGVYRVTVKRVAANVYQDMKSNHVIITRSCFVLTLWEDAILVWEGRFGSSRLIFLVNKQECDVEDVL